jgi:CRISPR-associated protein Cmr2
MMKRLWPNRFRQWIKEEAGLDLDVQRYVVSTHTMALASSLEKLLEEKIENGEALQKLLEHAKDLETVALPRCLMRKVHECPDPVRAQLARRLPALLEKLRENEEGELNPQAKEKALRLREATENLVRDALGNKPERYYALILMDGDNMGAWLAGNEEQYRLAFRGAWHSKVRSGIEPIVQGNARLRDYLHEKRPASPARHMAISSALNGFALDLARHIVEDLCKGKLIYAGGDDVLAMVTIDDMPRCLWLLRLAYSGTMPEGQEPFFGHLDLEMKNGFVLWERSRKDRRFYRVMGEKATASAGAVVAHHTAPLGAVLRELRQAEKPPRPCPEKMPSVSGCSSAPAARSS